MHFLPDNLQEPVWRSFDRLTPVWPVTYRSSAEDWLATLARLGVRHHAAMAYSHQPGMLRYLNDHTLRLAKEVPAVIQRVFWHNGLRLFGLGPPDQSYPGCRLYREGGKSWISPRSASRRDALSREIASS